MNKVIILLISLFISLNTFSQNVTVYENVSPKTIVSNIYLLHSKEKPVKVIESYFGGYVYYWNNSILGFINEQFVVITEEKSSLDSIETLLNISNKKHEFMYFDINCNSSYCNILYLDCCQ